MPSKSEKQRKFFGAAMSAKKGKGKVTGAAKKVAKEMPEKEIKKFLKKESYDDIVNAYLKTYIIEMDVRMDPREGFNDDPFIDPTEDMSGGVELTPEEMRKIVTAEVGEEQALTMSDQDIEYFYNHHFGEPEDVSELEKNILALQPNNEEDYEEECEDNCQCDRCKDGGGEKMLNFYGFTK